MVNITSLILIFDEDHIDIDHFMNFHYRMFSINNVVLIPTPSNANHDIVKKHVAKGGTVIKDIHGITQKHYIMLHTYELLHLQYPHHEIIPTSSSKYALHEHELIRYPVYANSEGVVSIFTDFKFIQYENPSTKPHYIVLNFKCTFDHNHKQNVDTFVKKYARLPCKEIRSFDQYIIKDKTLLSFKVNLYNQTIMGFV